MKKGLAVLFLLALPSVPLDASEVLQNGSFDTTDAWQVAPAILAVNPGWTGGIGSGQANLHPSPPAGYTGVILYQDLNTPVVGGSTCVSTITLSRNSSPAGNSIAVYLDYQQANGVTRQMVLFNPNNFDVWYATSFTNTFTLPSDARTLVRLSLAKLASGSFNVNDISLDAPLLESHACISGLNVNDSAFSFSVTGTVGLSCVVQASSNLTHGAWVPLTTNTLSGGSFYFSDPTWKSTPVRFYSILKL